MSLSVAEIAVVFRAGDTDATSGAVDSTENSVPHV